MNLTVRYRITWEWILSYKDYMGVWRQKSKSGYTTKAEAKSAGNSFMATFDAPRENSDYTFKKVAEIHETIIERSYNTQATYKAKLDNFEAIHDIKLSEIDFETVQEIINNYYKLNKYGSTKALIQYGSSIFRFADRKLKIKADNPFSHVSVIEKQEKSKKIIKTYTLAQMEDVFKKLDGNTDLRVYTMLAGLCGLRLGEIRGLTRSCVDLKGLTIKIEKQRGAEQKEDLQFKPLKSKNSYRTLKIPNTLAENLKAYPLPLNDNMAILPMLRSFEIRRSYDKLKIDLTIHEFRHSFATNLIQRGVDFRTIAMLMGDTLDTVIKNYSHVNIDMRELADGIMSSF